MSKQESKENQPIMTYKAIDLSNGKVIAEGDDFLKVNKRAESLGIAYKMNFVPNPNLSFVF